MTTTHLLWDIHTCLNAQKSLFERRQSRLFACDHYLQLKNGHPCLKFLWQVVQPWGPEKNVGKLAVGKGDDKRE